MAETYPVARFTLICPECVRVEYRYRGRFLDAPSMFASYRNHPERASVPVEVADREGGAEFRITTERMELVFTPKGEGLTADSLRVQVRGAGGAGTVGEWMPGAMQRANLGGTLSTLDGLRRRPRHGLPPGLLARDGWHVIDDSRGHAVVDGWARARVHEGVEEGSTDWYVFAYGQDYRAALRALTTVGGRVPMPRRYLLGSWYSRYWPHTSTEFREIVEEYDRRGLPLDVMVLDMDWHRDGWTGYSWNRELLPDAEALVDWLHQRGLAVTLNLHPADGVGPHEDRYAAYMHAIGQDASSGRTVPFDAGDRRQIHALFEQVLRPLEQQGGWEEEGRSAGADFWWVDWQQERFVRSIAGLTNLQWLNQLFFEHAARGRERGLRGVSFSRWAGIDRENEGWGDHRYPIHFSGDAHTGWEMLAFQVPFTAAAGNVGCFFWSHDIGGHFGPRIEEAAARWVQFGALSAAVRLHSARTGVLDRRPWTYAAPFAESMRLALRRRAELMPYLYTQVRACHEDSVPLLRPMYVEFGDQEEAYQHPGQYLLGSDVLCAPIVEAGIGPGCVASQVVWFPPAGAGWPRTWHGWTTGERYFAGDEAIVAAGIDGSPVFAAGGVPIPMQSAKQRGCGINRGEIMVRLWPGLPGEVHERNLYEDDGVSTAHERGECSRTRMRAEWIERRPGRRGLRLEIGPTVGRFGGQVEERGIEVQLGGIEAVETMTIDGNSASVRGEARPADREGARVQVVSIGPRSIRDGLTIELTLRVLDARRMHVRARAGLLEGAGIPHGLVVEQSHAAGNPELIARLASLCAKCEPRLQIDGWAIGLGVGLKRCGAECRLIDTFGQVDREPMQIELMDQIGRRMVTRLQETRVWQGESATGRSRSLVLPKCPAKLAEPPLGLKAVRWAGAEVTIGGHRVRLALELATRLRAVPGPAWRVVGPFAWDWARSITEQRFSPEMGLGMGPNHWHDGGNGDWKRWKRGVTSEQWPLDVRSSLHAHEGLAYALTHVVSSRRQRSRLVLESADKVEVWLNGVKVYSMDGFETEAALEGGAWVDLPQGRSTLLVKTSSGGGGWGFALRMDGEAEVGAEVDDAEPTPSHPVAG